MDADRSRSQASLPSPTWIFSAPINLLLTLSQSLDLASIWYHDSSLLTGLLLRLFSGGHKLTPWPLLEWTWSYAMVPTAAHQASKDQICAKESSSLWGEGRGMAAQCGWVEDKATGRAKGQRGRLQPQGTMEEEEISEIQTRKYGKEWNIGALGPGRQGWSPRLCMNNQMSHIVSWVRLRWSPGFQGPSTIMRELMTQGRNFLVSPFHGQFPRKISLQCHWSNLHPLGIESPWHTDKEVKSRCGAKSLARF